jgi:hypothetical protein
MAVKLASHAPVEGKATEIYVAVLPKGKRTKPIKSTLTATAAAKGATSITVAGLIGIIQKGQYLMFVGTDGEEFLCQVNTTTEANATSLTVVVLPEAIPTGAIAEFPTYIWDRKSADLDRSYNFSGVTTFNTGGSQDGIITGVEKKISLPGLYYFKNAGYKTIKWCAENDREFWMIREMPAPTDGYTAGDRIEGPAVCTGIKEGAPDDGFVNADMDITLLGKIVETDPVPVVV